jgi:hypothetical protein
MEMKAEAPMSLIVIVGAAVVVLAVVVALVFWLSGFGGDERGEDNGR